MFRQLNLEGIGLEIYSAQSAIQLPPSCHGASTQGSVLTGGLMTSDWLSCLHWGILCHLRYLISFHCWQAQVYVIPTSLVRVSAAARHADSTMHRYTAKWAGPWISGNLNRGLGRVCDTRTELHLDADLKLNAAQMKVAL